MKPAESTVKLPMSDIALKVRTGHGWVAWCRLLDEAGAAKKSHSEIAQLVGSLHTASGWYSQMITVGYERLRGLREVNQHRGGLFEASASKTMPISAETAFGFFEDARRRARWLTEKIAIRKAVPPKSVRFAWPDETGVEVWIAPRGRDKCSVAVQHSRLPDAKTRALRKKFWKDALERLAAAAAPEPKPVAKKKAVSAKKPAAKNPPAKKKAAGPKKAAAKKKPAAKKKAVRKPARGRAK